MNGTGMLTVEQSVQIILTRLTGGHIDCATAGRYLMGLMDDECKRVHQEALQSGMPPGLEITEEQVAELDRLEASATSGTWEAENKGDSYVEIKSPEINRVHITVDSPSITTDVNDGEFICAARNLMRPLLTDRDRLMALLRDLNQDGGMGVYRRGYEDGQSQGFEAGLKEGDHRARELIRAQADAGVRKIREETGQVSW